MSIAHGVSLRTFSIHLGYVHRCPNAGAARPQGTAPESCRLSPNASQHRERTDDDTISSRTGDHRRKATIHPVLETRLSIVPVFVCHMPQFAHATDCGRL
jgi:hypothetical protein